MHVPSSFCVYSFPLFPSSLPRLCFSPYGTLLRLHPLLNGRCTSLLRPPVSEMTCTVSSGTLNSTIPYHTSLSLSLPSPPLLYTLNPVMSPGRQCILVPAVGSTCPRFLGLGLVEWTLGQLTMNRIFVHSDSSKHSW